MEYDFLLFSPFWCSSRGRYNTHAQCVCVCVLTPVCAGFMYLKHDIFFPQKNYFYRTFMWDTTPHPPTHPPSLRVIHLETIGVIDWANVKRFVLQHQHQDITICLYIHTHIYMHINARVCNWRRCSEVAPCWIRLCSMDTNMKSAYCMNALSHLPSAFSVAPECSEACESTRKKQPWVLKTGALCNVIWKVDQHRCSSAGVVWMERNESTAAFFFFF